MGKILLKCENCHSYTFSKVDTKEQDVEKICPACNGLLKTPHPPKFSLDNKYSKYLRQMKKEDELSS